MNSYKIQSHTAGFSLIELSISMLIMASMLSVLLYFKQSYTTNQKEEITRTRIQNIEQALSIFVADNRRVPCPALYDVALDSPDFGKSKGDRDLCVLPTKIGNIAIGSIPTRTLGLHDNHIVDGWGRRFSYIMVQTCNATDIATDLQYAADNFTNCPGEIQITYPNNDVISGNIYLIISHGKNGYGALDFFGNSQIIESTDLREKENSKINTQFYDDVGDDILYYGTRQKLLQQARLIDAKFNIEAYMCGLVQKIDSSAICGNYNGTNCIDYFQQLLNAIRSKCF